MRYRYAYPQHGRQDIDLCDTHAAPDARGTIEAHHGSIGPIQSALSTGCAECDRLVMVRAEERLADSDLTGDEYRQALDNEMARDDD